MKVYLTKYALTRGIQTEIGDPNEDGIIKVPGGRWPKYYGPQDWSSSKDEALKRATELKNKRIASLKKQISRLESMKFEIEE